MRGNRHHTTLPMEANLASPEGSNSLTPPDSNPEAFAEAYEFFRDLAINTDDIDAFKAHLDACGVAYSDYGTRFARAWHQIFFLDPEGVIVEVHAVPPKE